MNSTSNAAQKLIAELQDSNQNLKEKHLQQERTLNAINRINQLVIAANNLDEMLNQVLSEYLTLFNCDRAWLLTPCDPNATSYRIPKERCRPDWPGANAEGLDIPMDEFSSSIFSKALAHPQAFCFGSHNIPQDHPVANQFSVKSQMILALYPKIGVPWLIGIHHCEQEVEFNEHQIQLFETLGGRVTDGLSSFLSWQRTKDSEELQRIFLNNSTAPICIKDLSGNILLTNFSWQQLFIGTKASQARSNIYDHIPRQFADELLQQDQQVVGLEKSVEFEQNLPTQQGFKSFLTVKFPLFNENKELYAVGSISTDVTARKKAEQRVEKLAYFDPLTDLPNRRLLQNRLEHAIAASKRAQNYGALIFIDLDDFKTLNDTKGHLCGDQLLIETARRLQLCVREEDTICRLGGDEFVVMVEHISLEEEQAISYANLIGQKILSQLQTVFTVNDYQHHGTASIGITLFYGESHTPDELLKRVDSAMYEAKRSGRNRLRFYDPVLQSKMEYKAQLTSKLHDAIEQQQFSLYLQPQISDKNEIIGAEALLRWQEPENGFISPADFIPIAEETDIILEIGRWVLEQGCQILNRWQQDPLLNQLVLSLNVSVKQFKQEDFVEQVKSIITKSHAPIEKIKLEITESIEQDGNSQNIEKMQQLSNASIALSMDDFGTGYSSLASLRKLPLNQLKIDQSFVADIDKDSDGETIVKTIIGMANNLKLDVIAEGVENETQRDFLTSNGCLTLQGYLYSKPLPLDQFESYVKSIAGNLN